MRRLPCTGAAFAYAELKHRGQRRPDGTPFILHPVEVASLLHSIGSPDQLVAAGVLHDVVEKADASAGELEARFGARVRELVFAVSDDERIRGYTARKAALRRQVAAAGEEALALFAADKLSKLRELCRESLSDRAAGESEPGRSEARARRVKHYERSLALLEERLPNSPLVQQLRDELRRFLPQRPVLADAR